ncbi:MAG TPA: hypothetical protein VL422_13975, partial [Miltoncostaea sp.]|nr:hypothetical protein [Miltoncostaea sp.]
YFSTAVSRREYLAGRVAAAVLPLLLVTLVPLLVLFVGIIVFEESPLGWFEDNWQELPRIVAAGLILALYYGLVGLAVASLTGRRAFAIGGYLLLLVAPTVVFGLISEAIGGDPGWPQLGQLSVLQINFAASIWPDSDVPNSTGAWALMYLLVVGIAVLTLLRRYSARSEA